jgi:hypothetical protein
VIRFLTSSIFTALLIALSAGPVLAGAWTQGKGKVYDKLGFNFYYAGKNFDPDGGKVGMDFNGIYRDYNVNNYIEYGLTDDLTIISSMVYKRIDKDDIYRELTTWGVGDIDVSARYKLVEGIWGILSSQALLKIPSAYDKNDQLPLGNGQFDYEGKLLYGRSLYPYIPGYFNLELGYRFRAGDPSDEFRYLVEFGADITRSLYGRMKLDGIYSIDNGNKYAYDGNPTTTNNFDLGKLEVTAGYKITPAWGVELTFTPSLYGQNTAAGTNYSLAVFYKTP